MVRSRSRRKQRGGACPGRVVATAKQESQVSPLVSIGYSIASEEHPPDQLIDFSARAEEAGFSYAMISDHYHPWISAQGQSSHVWSVLGGIARATSRLRVGTGVTCPIIRNHPALIAQAAATVGMLMPGRFMLGLGTGENLNEHIVGEPWPPFDERSAMLAEAVEIIRELWRGEMVTHRGEYFTVENARLYSLPGESPPINLAAAGPKAAQLAASAGDGLINFSADPKVTGEFNSAGGHGKPRFVQYNVCWAADEASARRTAHEICPNVALKGPLGQELPLPVHFEQAVQMVTEDDVAQVIVCGPDPEKHAAGIQKCVDAGYDHVHVYQVGPDQEGFFRFYEDEILPRFN
jgi:coenzyme F420-dependent glucose-6-phosphate dehydrogenase